MSSFTSSSDRRAKQQPAPSLVELLRLALPLLIVVGVLLAAAELWYRSDPFPWSTQLASDTYDILYEQVTRAKSLPDVDVLILGDSTALMDVDAARLSDLLNCRVESLATVGYVGPAGYGALLDTYIDRGRSTRELLVLVSPVTLALPEQWDWARIIREDGGLPPLVPQPPVIGAMEKVRTELLYKVVYYPYNLGPYGAFYGGYQQFRKYIQTHHGSAVDPTPPQGRDPYNAGYPPYLFERSSWWRDNLPGLANAIGRFDVSRTFLTFTPITGNYESTATLESRAEALDEVAGVLGLARTNLLALPSSLPTPLFASGFHLNERGRALYTELVGNILYQQKVCG